MKAYIWITFGALALGYYELSGGADFEPGTNGLQVFAAVETTPLDAPEVSRLALVDMTSVAQAAPTSENGSDTALQAAVMSAIRSTDTQADLAETRVTFVIPVDEATASEDVPDAVEAAEEPAAPALDLRTVNASRVNLRNGPGQDHGVLAKLAAGTTVRVLEDTGQGWVQLQVVPQGRIGWVADYLLDAS